MDHLNCDLITLIWIIPTDSNLSHAHFNHLNIPEHFTTKRDDVITFCVPPQYKKDKLHLLVLHSLVTLKLLCLKPL